VLLLHEVKSMGWVNDFVGPRAEPDAVKKRNLSTPRESNLGIPFHTQTLCSWAVRFMAGSRMLLSVSSTSISFPCIQSFQGSHRLIGCCVSGGWVGVVVLQGFLLNSVFVLTTGCGLTYPAFALQGCFWVSLVDTGRRSVLCGQWPPALSGIVFDIYYMSQEFRSCCKSAL
jgi:hypothetical protein